MRVGAVGAALGLGVMGIRSSAAQMPGSGSQIQQPPLLPSSQTQTQSPITAPNLDTLDPAEMARLRVLREKQMNDERRRKLVADTERLLELSTELKTEVDKATKNELSVTVVQKAAEIERLAHDVRTRMTQ
jgi:hypothetical protein